MKKILYLTIVSVFMLQAPAHAAWVSATIKQADPQNGILIVERNGAEIQEAYPKELEVKILSNAKLKNIASLEDLQAGQEVKLDVRANKEQGTWDSNYVELIDADADSQVDDKS